MRISARRRLKNGHSTHLTRPSPPGTSAACAGALGGEASERCVRGPARGAGGQAKATRVLPRVEQSNREADGPAPCSCSLLAPTLVAHHGLANGCLVGLDQRLALSRLSARDRWTINYLSLSLCHTTWQCSAVQAQSLATSPPHLRCPPSARHTGEPMHSASKD